MWKRITIKFFRISGVLLGLLILCLVGFHFWFKAHARTVIRELVAIESKGHLAADLGSFEISYRKLRLNINDLDLQPATRSDSSTATAVKVGRVSLQIRSLWSLVFHRKLTIDSIVCVNPQVTIYKSQNQVHRMVSPQQEIGRIYLTIQRAMNSLQVKKLDISKGSIEVRESQATGDPMHVSDIDLTIDNLKIDTGRIEEQPFLFSERIIFKSSNQDIRWNGGKNRMVFRHLELDTYRKQLIIDSGLVKISQADSTPGNIQLGFRRLKIVRPHLRSLYLGGGLQADTIDCDRPDLIMDLYAHARSDQATHQSLAMALQKLSGDIRVGTLHVKEASFDISSHRTDTLKRFISNENSFTFSDILLHPDPYRPVSIGKINMVVRNYFSYSSDSAYTLAFDSVSFGNNQADLFNLHLSSAPSQKTNRRTDIIVPRFVMNDISWPDLLFDRRLVAGSAVLTNPVVHLQSGDRGRVRQKASLYEILRAVGRSFQLEEFRMINGNLTMEKPDLRFELKAVNTLVDSRKLVDSNNADNIASAVKSLSFSKALIQNRRMDIELFDTRFNGSDQSLQVKRLAIRGKQPEMKLQARQVSIREIEADSTEFVAEGIRWNEADLFIQLPEQPAAKHNARFALSLNDISGKNTRLDLHKGNLSVKTTIDQLVVPGMEKRENLSLKTGSLIEGHNLVLEKGNARLTMQRYQLHGQQPSAVYNVQFRREDEMDSTSLVIPEIRLQPDIHALVKKQVRLDYLHLLSPVIEMSRNGQAKQRAAVSSLPDLEIGELKVENPVAMVRSVRNSQATVVSLPAIRSGPASQIKLMQLKVLPAERKLTIANINGRLQKPLVTTGKMSLETDNYWQVALSDFDGSLAGDSAKGDWSARLNVLEILQTRFNKKGNGKPVMVEVESLALSNALIGKREFADHIRMLEKSPKLSIDNLTGTLQSGNTYIRYEGVTYQQQLRRLLIDSLSYRPVLSRDSFIASVPYQTNYITTTISNLQIDEVKPEKFIRDSMIHLKQLIVDRPVIRVYKDKTLPYVPGPIKPLPVSALKDIPVRFSLDTVHIRNGQVYYTERSAKTKKEGTVFLTRMDARLFPVKNTDLAADDSLRLRAEAYLMDSSWVGLRMRESYVDTLSGFLLTLKMRPSSLTILNPMLEPTTTVKLVSGQLDTLDMKAVGREYLSLGTMTMHYHDLKLAFIRQDRRGKEARKGMVKGFVSMVANFVVHTNNRHRPGKVYFPRDRNRAIFHYWVKMTLSGVATSVGVKHSRKYNKKYRRELKRLNLPPI